MFDNDIARGLAVRARIRSEHMDEQTARTLLRRECPQWGESRTIRFFAEAGLFGYRQRAETVLRIVKGERP